MLRNSGRRAAALVVLALCACKGSSYWLDRVQAEPLYRRAGELRDAGSCAKLVPMEFGQTMPVPVKGDAFKVLFYPIDRGTGKPQAMSPLYSGTFGRDPDIAPRCDALGGKAAPRGPAAAAGVSQTAYYRAELGVFASLDKAAELYGKAASPEGADKKALEQFASDFAKIAEPGLLADYYRVNPDFWEWLRKEAGSSIPKA